MNFTFETQGTNTFLVYRVADEEVLDSLSFGMVANNRITGVAPVLFTQMDAAKCLKYNVTAKVTAAKFLSGSVTRKQLLGLLSGIAGALLEAEEYMIEPSVFVLDPETIFVDVSTVDTLLVCLPVANPERPAVDLSVFFKNIVFSARYDQTENNDYVAKIISYLNGAANFSLPDFAAMIKSAMPGAPTEPAGAAAAPAAEPQPNVGAAVSRPEPLVQTCPQPSPATEPEEKITLLHLLMHYSKENQAAYSAQKERERAAQPPAPRATSFAREGGNFPAGPQSFAIPGQENPMPVGAVANRPAIPPVAAPPSPGRPANFGETTVLNNVQADATTVLGADSVAVPYLIRVKNNERISLNKPAFRIGKEKSFVDYFIGDNAAISRSHADFTAHDGECYVTDMNSTNHTYVDGEMIQSGAEVKLAHGAKVRLANEEFEFRIY